MFDETEIIEFFNRIINAPELKEEEIEANVAKFYDYLVLTHMCDEESLTKLHKLVTCLHEIITIKNTIGYIDVNSLLQAEEEKPMKLTKKPRKKPQPKHYNHYHDDDYSSGCGGRPNQTTVRRSSSSCGGSSTESGSCGRITYVRNC